MRAEPQPTLAFWRRSDIAVLMFRPRLARGKRWLALTKTNLVGLIGIGRSASDAFLSGGKRLASTLLRDVRDGARFFIGNCAANAARFWLRQHFRQKVRIGHGVGPELLQVVLRLSFPFDWYSGERVRACTEYDKQWRHNRNALQLRDVRAFPEIQRHARSRSRTTHIKSSQYLRSETIPAWSSSASRIWGQRESLRTWRDSPDSNVQAFMAKSTSFGKHDVREKASLS